MVLKYILIKKNLQWYDNLIFHFAVTAFMFASTKVNVVL